MYCFIGPLLPLATLLPMFMLLDISRKQVPNGPKRLRARTVYYETIKNAQISSHF